jgi:hypothetical protein
MSSAEEIAALLGGRPSKSGWMARCPTHNDRSPSLSIGVGRDGKKVVVHCHADCPQPRVVSAINQMGHTLEGEHGKRYKGLLPARRVVGRFEYQDENGEVVYRVVKWLTGDPTKPKDFVQERLDDKGKWISGITGIERVPYKLPELLAADPNLPVYIPEGEKDVDRLISVGAVSTCNSGGAGKNLPELVKRLPGRYAVLLQDNDAPGRKHTDQLAALLNGVARRIKIVRFTGLLEKGDVSDWFDQGHTFRELERLARKTPDWLPGAAPPADKETPVENSDDEAEIARLAALPLLEYERERQPAAERLGVRIGVLDKLVDAKRAESAVEENDDTGGQGRPIEFREILPWERPVDGARLLSDLSCGIRRYVVIEQQQADAIALWVLFTHTFDAFEFAIKIIINSPTKRSGKTRLIEVLDRLVIKSLPISGITPAALLRLIEIHKPTLLLDEFDTLMRGGGEMSQALQGLLNSGFDKPMARHIKNVSVSDGNWDPRAFSTWCPQVLSGIGKVVTDTVTDRAILINMKRKLRSEMVARLRSRDGSDLQILSRRTARWAQDHIITLGQTLPNLPEEINDRAADAWEPLFAIADVARGDWPNRARAAAIKLSGEADSDSINTMLLSDIRIAFDNLEETQGDKLASRELVEALNKMLDRPWPEFKGRPLTQNALARLLNEFGINPKDINISRGKNPKGYWRRQFEDAWSRYLDAPPVKDQVKTSVFDDVATIKPTPNQQPSNLGDKIIANLRRQRAKS